MAGSESATDGTPIKPVSSLRSHFENMASLRPSSRAQLRPPPPPNPPHLVGQRDTCALERISLDMPRTLLPTGAPGTSALHGSQLQERSIDDPNTLSLQSNSSLRRRPISMSSLSSSRSPPAMTIDPPLSPPKPFALPRVKAPKPSSTQSPSRLTGFIPQSPHKLPVRPQRSPNASPFPERMDHSWPQSRGTLPDMKPSGDGNKFSRVDLTTKNVPPPVKRGGKPKILSKPGVSWSNTNLEITPAVDSQRISPFSTPPGSDDNPDSDSANGQRSVQSYPEAPIVGSCEALPVRHHGREMKSTAKGDSDQKSSGLNVQLGRVFPPPFTPNDSRPGLPPRQEAAIKAPYAPPIRPISMLNRTWTEQASRGKRVATPTKPRISLPHSILPTDPEVSKSGHMPPPKRAQTSTTIVDSINEPRTGSRRQYLGLESAVSTGDDDRPDTGSKLSSSITHPSYPDTSYSNRRPPYIQDGVRAIELRYETKLFEISSRYICTTGYLTRAWDLASGDMVLNVGHDEKEMRATALAFKPGACPEDEGLRIWLGTNYGDLQELDVPCQTVLYTKSAAHSRREIIKIFRHQNSMWTLDDDGTLLIWAPDRTGLPNLQSSPLVRKINKGHSFSLIIQDNLWLAAGKEIRIFRPNSNDEAAFSVSKQPLCQPGVGEVTSGAVVSDQLHCVYFAHTDGKVTAYSTADFTCLGVFNVSVYKINTLVGAGSYLWAGYNSGMIAVYDTRTQPWTAKKEWQAHSHPVTNILVDRSSVWKSGILRVASIGLDNLVRLWDGMLKVDWLESDMQIHDVDYCTFREIKATIVTWNAGASTPTSLRYDDKGTNFFQEVMHVEKPPELLVFGFQELIDLEDKKLTAKSFFKGNKKKDSSEQDHMSRQYRDWRDYLIRRVEDNMPHDEPYHLLHTASMMGLFSCVFVKASQRVHISNVFAAEIKRGLGGLHGNKGALILRFVLDNTSICLVNCHLAAGQSQTVHRNNDAAAILESSVLSPERDSNARCDSYVAGGDGTMILDHEICILNGDLNYRIDTMGRDTVIKAIKAGSYTKLLERDQLLVSRRRNPMFRLRAFAESPILFAPTYKYDIGSDRYDTSEKHRAPAWCDRILYRGAGKVKPVEYRRHELQVSDHRPVSASFKMRIKSISPSKRSQVWEACTRRFEILKHKLSNEAKIEYLRDVMGVDANEAKGLIAKA